MINLKPLSEWTVEEVMQTIPALSQEEAAERIERSKRIRALVVKSGRCPDCGCDKHPTGVCPLKTRSNKELMAEAKRREKDQ